MVCWLPGRKRRLTRLKSWYKLKTILSQTQPKDAGETEMAISRRTIHLADILLTHGHPHTEISRVLGISPNSLSTSAHTLPSLRGIGRSGAKLHKGTAGETIDRENPRYTERTHHFVMGYLLNLMPPETMTSSPNLTSINLSSSALVKPLFAFEEGCLLAGRAKYASRVEQETGNESVKFVSTQENLFLALELSKQYSARPTGGSGGFRPSEDLQGSDWFWRGALAASDAYRKALGQPMQGSELVLYTGNGQPFGLAFEEYVLGVVKDVAGVAGKGVAGLAGKVTGKGTGKGTGVTAYKACGWQRKCPLRGRVGFSWSEPTDWVGGAFIHRVEVVGGEMWVGGVRRRLRGRVEGLWAV